MKHFSIGMLSVAITIACSGSALAAGLVLVEVSSGILFVTGDTQPNQIKVADPENDGTWLITGSAKTLINGHPSVTVVEAFDNMRIDLKEGDDSLKVTGGTLAGALDVRLGEADDKAQISRITLQAGLVVEGEEGEDSVSLKDVTTLDPGSTSTVNMQAPSGTDTDRVKIKGFVGWRLNVRFGEGDDRCSIADLAFPIEGFSFLTVFGNGGRDQVSLKSVVSQQFTAVLGDGNGDRLKISRSTTSQNTLDGGNGTEDRLQVSDDSSLGTGTPVGFEE